MATSLQRLMILTILLLVMVHLTARLYSMADINEITDVFNNQSEDQKQYTEDYYNKIKTTTPDVSTIILDKQAGDPKYGGKSMITTFLDNGKGVLGMIKYDGNNELERMLTSIVNWIIGLLYIVLGLEVFLMIVNRKTT